MVPCEKSFHKEHVQYESSITSDLKLWEVGEI